MKASAMKQECDKGSLKPNAGLLDVVMLGAGSAIGSSIFSVLGPAARVGGESLLWAILAAMVPMAILALVYAAVASAAPRSGASYEWPRMFIGPRFAFMVAWLRIFGSVGMLVTGSLVLAHYLAILTPLPPTATMMAIFTVLFALNLFGIALAAKAQTWLMLILLATFSIFIGEGWGRIDPSRLGELWGRPAFAGIFLTLPLLINLFMGIETATEIGEEVRDASRNVPLGILLAVLLTLAVYLLITMTALALIGWRGIASGDTPLVVAAQATGTRYIVPVMLGAGILCLVKSLNVNFMIFSRNLYAMGRAGVLPAPLGRVHGSWGTPHVAATAVFLLTCLGLLLPKDLVFLFTATSIPTVLKYISTCLSARAMAIRQPELVATARFRLRPGTLIVVAMLGATCAMAIAVAALATDWRAYVLIGVWALLGILYRIAARRHEAKGRTVASKVPP
ncbi:APC family permease [Novosphingobium sp. 11B]